MSMRIHFFLCLCSVFLLVKPGMSSEKPTVFVSILPQKFFVEQLAGDLVDVEVMVKPGASPATYEPKVSQMRKLASSVIYFSIGVPFEQAWLERIQGVNPQMVLVKTDTGITKLAMAEHLHDHDEAHVAHEEHKGHGHEDDHPGHHDEHHAEGGHHDGLDPHIWLSPRLVRLQAATIAESLVELLPAKRAGIETRLSAFNGKIDLLEEELGDVLEGKQGMRFMVFHPSWGYFADNFGLVQIPIEFEGKGPKSSQLRELILLAKKENIRVVFAQPQFSTKSAALIAREIKGEVITVDPLAENWLENMRAVAIKFRDALQ